MTAAFIVSVWLLTPLQTQTATLRIDVRALGAPVAAADVVIGRRTYRTDAEGRVSIEVPAGSVEMTVVKEGFVPLTTSIAVQANQVQPVLVELERQPTLTEHVTVSATRTDKGVEDLPMRVEVLGKEELDEKILMTPGDIVMMLNEMGGLRVQATSPSLGAASVRIQGMRGRYTRFFFDGLPLFGQQVGGFGLLQIPPVDLGQVEVIKGVASALYGAGAMGGVVNLVSRRGGPEPTRDLLVNRSNRGATDAVAFFAQPLTPRWSATLLAGGHGQSENDVNGDGWADLPGYNRAEIRPRLFWDDHQGRSFFATAGASWESRHGGTIPGAVLPSTGTPYLETLDTGRFDVGAMGQARVGKTSVLTARAAVARQTHDHAFGELRERDHHDTGFGEVALRGAAGSHTWVTGVAVEQDTLHPQDLPQFAYRYTVPGVFAQDDVNLTPWLAISVSGRLDDHNQFGSFFSPRVSALVRSGRWNSRLSVGSGFFAPTPLTEETEAAGLSRLTIRRALKAERGTSASLDFSRTDGPFTYTLTLFTSRIRNPVKVDVTNAYTMTNLPEPTTNTGIELLATIRRGLLSGTATYTYVRSRELREDVPLTPRQNLGLIGIWESEEVGRLGLEWYYTGRQRLEASPYRTESRPYMLFGALVEKRLRHARLFLNGENLANVRQTHWDPLLRPSRGIDGRWIVDGWAPLDGRNINGGLRLLF